ncbi:hydrolase, alpha/beta fold domain containing protein [Theileria equi strain WA]|uniref:Hydrolase, alpha/beta fold domain containing protein n=1 Tax=Theileria equi strain WA TaxID=1537102 RepID=L0AVS4_THEEQ|nr:hydrolase, alpha/beta fold domain containing protein [Theileria equi strain WA]AFZ79650.1 hydrolase, alpha/beta fold domain containing protein [Theileria equi strain WA]|eukprot:XP_004829316.1 hydrolase, alpha/beta fold domain containing protein [Theileria equi strain WA]
MSETFSSLEEPTSVPEEENGEASIEWCIKNGYKIPKWLLNCNIKCPFVKGKIFQGVHGPINYSVAGNPNGSLVLTFHGYNASHTTFATYQNVLSKNGFLVVAFDLYGHGLSGYPRYKIFGDTFTPKYYVDQADELINHLGYKDRKLSIIGLSMGACLAAAYCERYPKNVERLILISPAGLIPKKPVRVRLLKYIQCCIPCASCCVCRCCFSRYTHVPKRKQEQIVSDDEDDEYHDTVSVDLSAIDVTNTDSSGIENSEKYATLSPTMNRMLWSLFVTRRALSNILGIVNRMPLWTSHDLYTRVGELNKQTLILFGENDTLTPPQSAEILSKLFKNSHTIVFPNSDHLLSFKRPIEVVSTCLAFLGIPSNERIANYTRWLPFDSAGNYIPKSDREINYDFEDDNGQDEQHLGSSGGTMEETDVPNPPLSALSTFRFFNTRMSPFPNVGNLLIGEELTKQKVPLVVVTQLENL